MSITGEVPQSKKKREKKPGHIPRPPNAFILFRSYMQRTRFKGGEIPQRKISILLGEEWRGMPEERKAYWNMEAKKVKDAHAQQYPDYRYNPVHQRKVKKYATSQRPAGDSQAPRKQRRHKDRDPIATSQAVVDSRKVTATRKAARSRKSAKMCNTEDTSRNQSDSSYTYALEPEPSGSQKAEIGPIVPLREIKLPTLGNLMPEAAATARRPFESYALSLSPQGFQDPPFLSRRPAPSVTQFSATSHTSVRRQLEADMQIQRAPAGLGVFIPTSVAENVPPVMELPSYELQGSVDDHWQDTILSWSLGQEAPAQQAVQPSYPWPEEQDWALPAHGPGANEGSWYTYDAPEIAPSGSYATSYEVEQWYRALAGHPSYS